MVARRQTGNNCAKNGAVVLATEFFIGVNIPFDLHGDLFLCKLCTEKLPFCALGLRDGETF